MHLAVLFSLEGSHCLIGYAHIMVDILNIIQFFQIFHNPEHLECIINQSDPTELKLCHFGIDTEYLVQGIRPYHGWGGITDNSPPEIREKDAFRELLYSNKEYGT